MLNLIIFLYKRYAPEGYNPEAQEWPTYQSDLCLNCGKYSSSPLFGFAISLANTKINTKYFKFL